MKPEDMGQIMDIWLSANLDAHPYGRIMPGFWVLSVWKRIISPESLWIGHPDPRESVPGFWIG